MQSGNGTSGSDLFTGYEPSMSVGVVPPGSRLAQYLHPSRPSPWNSQSQGASSSYPIANPSSPLSASNVPSFVPSFAQVGLGDDKDVNVPISVGPYSMPSSSQRSLNYGSMIPMHMRQDGHMLSETGNSVPPNYMQEKFGGTTYFFQPNQNTIENCRSDSQNGRILVCGSGNFAYQGPPPHIGKFRPKSGILSYFSSPDLRLELLQRQLAVQCRADPSMFRDIPQNVEHFRNLVPLENMKISGLNHLERTVLGTSMTIVYKAISIRDGMPYCIRRVLNVRLGSPKQLALADNWKKLLHANVVQLRDVIQTRAFNDNSLLFIYDYHPLSETLKYRHLNNGRMNGMSSTFMEGTGGVQEHLLWAYIVQLSSALRAIHASGMAARTVDPTKIIVFSKTKLMLSSCGILDVIAPENGHSSLQHQQVIVLLF
ncbi:hypothetical protein AB6A40_009162 [Gnathostoma spinigerum]|uniref:Protein kinase domain-containing protein n=1 Tax=Gnathostoma spinigerum TaxID=75299 RepID=A0ABD6EZB7_9BILA